MISNDIVDIDNMHFWPIPTKITEIYISCKAVINAEDYKNLKKITNCKGIEIVRMNTSEDKFKLL